MRKYRDSQEFYIFFVAKLAYNIGPVTERVEWAILKTSVNRI